MHCAEIVFLLLITFQHCYTLQTLPLTDFNCFVQVQITSSGSSVWNSLKFRKERERCNRNIMEFIWKKVIKNTTQAYSQLQMMHKIACCILNLQSFLPRVPCKFLVIHRFSSFRAYYYVIHCNSIGWISQFKSIISFHWN